MGKYNDVPAWYNLSSDGKSLEIEIHQAAYNLVVELMTDQAPIIPQLREDLNLPDFIPPAQDQWGYGEVLFKQTSQRKDWIKYRCPLPVIKKRNRKELDWDQAYAVSATLQAFFAALTLFELEGNSQSLDPSYLQLLNVSGMVTKKDMYGGAINILLRPAFIKWLWEKSTLNMLEKVKRLMIVADSTMWQEKKQHSFYGDNFHVRLADGKWLHLTVPGNACGLDPEHSAYPDAESYVIYPHNTDGPLQQLTLLVGMAILNQLARK